MEIEQIRSATEENSRLRNELHEMYKKFQALDSREFAFALCTYIDRED